MIKRGVLSLLILLISFGLALANEAQTSKLDTGDTAWMLISTALVMLMTVPGLALFYGGLSKKKDIVNTMVMCLVAYAIVSFLWVLYGYTLAFNGDVGGVIGILSKFMLNGVTMESLNGGIPEYLFISFQLTFAAITVALISGAYIERVKFSAWILFTILWFSLVYVPVAHWVWGGGFLAKLSALDFAGGTVVHINAGIAAFIGALFLGKRRVPILKPHNLTLVAIGTGLLWFGWFGFNAGSAIASNPLAGIAFLNTNTAAAIAALTWMIIERFTTGKATLLGFCSGAVAGLVAITPAAGFVNLLGAIIIGIFGALLPFFAVSKMKPAFGYDDALDVFGIHGIAGIIGAILTGILADPSINSAGRGLLYGNPSQLLIQALSIGIVIIYDLVITILILLFVKVITGLRISEEEELSGLDLSQHGERAYDLE